MSSRRIVFQDVQKIFGETEVFRNLSLAIEPGEFVAIIGPSGCGKTTLLNLLSGFERPSSGTISAHGKARTVFQHDGLFPWLTVAQNIELGLRDAKPSERQSEIQGLASLVHLDGFLEHYPHQISGGMRQRAELARALAGHSDILLLDEPFSALDFLTRIRMRQELSNVLEARPRTVVMVTHDVEEAAQLASRIIVLSQRPAEIVHSVSPNSPRLRHPTQPDVIQAIDEVLQVLSIGREERGKLTSNPQITKSTGGSRCRAEHS